MGTSAAFPLHRDEVLVRLSILSRMYVSYTELRSASIDLHSCSMQTADS